MKYPNSLEGLIEMFSSFPGIGKKTAERLALHALKFDHSKIDEFINSLDQIKEIKKCRKCGNITTNDLCDICVDNNRDNKTILVVEEVKDVIAIENMNEFNGLYHVLNGVIDFSNGVGVDDININSLIDRVDNDNIKEVILATNATTEGEMTARYIKNILSDKNINVTRIAYGLPVGGNLTYADELTLKKALEGRRNY